MTLHPAFVLGIDQGVDKAIVVPPASLGSRRRGVVGIRAGARVMTVGRCDGESENDSWAQVGEIRSGPAVRAREHHAAVRDRVPYLPALGRELVGFAWAAPAVAGIECRRCGGIA